MKEWLYQLLHEDYNLVRNLKPQLAELGVPLSLWLIQPENTLGILKPGISRAGRNAEAGKNYSPTIGVFTNIGETIIAKAF